MKIDVTYPNSHEQTDPIIEDHADIRRPIRMTGIRKPRNPRNRQCRRRLAGSAPTPS
jgi:hypothetical protein